MSDSVIRLPSGQLLPVLVQVRARSQQDAARAQRAEAVERHGSALAGYRSTPLLAVLGAPGSRRILVGRWALAASESGEIRAEAALYGRWDEDSDWERSEPDETDRPAFEPIDARGGDTASIITAAAKSAASAARTAVSDVRLICYELSEQIACGLKPNPERPAADLIPGLMALRSLISMARDEAREAVREQFELWFDDDDAYHSYRIAIDPTLMIDALPASAATRTWMSLHDATVRQSRAMEQQLSEQLDLLSSTLDAASSLWTAQQARASEGLNKVASAAAVGLGFPSLVLAYYGADQLVKLRGFAPTTIALMPLVIGAVPAAFMLRHHPPRSWRAGNAAWLATLLTVILATITVIWLVAVNSLGRT